MYQKYIIICQLNSQKRQFFRITSFFKLNRDLRAITEKNLYEEFLRTIIVSEHFVCKQFQRILSKKIQNFFIFQYLLYYIYTYYILNYIYTYIIFILIIKIKIS